MKIKVLYENQCANLEINQSISTRDLVLLLKPKLKFKNERPLVYNHEDKLLDMRDFIVPDESSKFPREFYIINIEPIKNKVRPNTMIDDLLMKVTGAEKTIDIASYASRFSRFSRYNFLENLFRDYPSSGQGENHENIRHIDSSMLNFMEMSNLRNPLRANSLLSISGHRNFGHFHNNLNAEENRIQVDLPEISQDLVQSLVEMGFTEDRARRALRISFNDVSHATELLLSDSDLLDLPDMQPLRFAANELTRNLNPVNVNALDQNQEEEASNIQPGLNNMNNVVGNEQGNNNFSFLNSIHPLPMLDLNSDSLINNTNPLMIDIQEHPFLEEEQDNNTSMLSEDNFDENF